MDDSTENNGASQRLDALRPGSRSRAVLQAVADKWTPLVLTALTAGPLRFTELQRGLGGVTPKMLTHTLRSLERDGLVIRTPYHQIPPRVEYALTDLGRSLASSMEILCDWAHAHADEVFTARGSFDAAPS